METSLEKEILQGIISALDDVIDNESCVYVNDDDNITYTFEQNDGYYIIVTHFTNKTRFFKLGIEEVTLMPVE